MFLTIEKIINYFNKYIYIYNQIIYIYIKKINPRNSMKNICQLIIFIGLIAFSISKCNSDDASPGEPADENECFSRTVLESEKITDDEHECCFISQTKNLYVGEPVKVKICMALGEFTRKDLDSFKNTLKIDPTLLDAEIKCKTSGNAIDANGSKSSSKYLKNGFIFIILFLLF